MKYFELDNTQKNNAALVNKELIKIGLTNPYLRAGNLAVVAKETGFIPRWEDSYSTTSARRIANIFGYSIFGIKPPQTPQELDLALTKIDIIKKNDESFFNMIYNRPIDLGNTEIGDGYKFRGGGFNQLTGRANYKANSTPEFDLIANPGLINTPECAAIVNAKFTRNSIVHGQRLGLMFIRFGIFVTSQISKIETGAKIAHQANMGWVS